jgi:hypothetical protein
LVPVVEGLHELPSLDQHPSPFEPPKPLLNFGTALCVITKCLMNHIIRFWAWLPKFLAKLDADVLLNFHGHCQCNMQDMNSNRYWLIACDWAIQAGGSNLRMRT